MTAEIRLEIYSTDGLETDTFDFWDGDVDRLAWNHCRYILKVKFIIITLQWFWQPSTARRCINLVLFQNPGVTYCQTTSEVLENCSPTPW